MRAAIFGWVPALAAVLLSGCGGDDRQPEGPPPDAAVTPIIAAAAAQQVQVGSSADVTVVFRAPAGLAARQLSITTGLSPLPAGWTTGTSSFACDTVGANDDCRLQLRYSPTLAGVTGTLNFGFAYTDAHGVQRRGSADIPYGTTAPNAVMATINPATPLQVALGSTALVEMTFRSNDGVPARDLTADVSALPVGWTVSHSELPCATIAADSACRLSLQFQPTAAVASSVLSLPYRYTDSGGTPRDGTASVTYGAIDGGTVTAAVTPGGLVDTFVGSTASVQVTFTAAAGSVSAMHLTSTLPAGWSVTSGTLPCTTLAAGASCQATLTYAPTSAVPSGTVPIDFRYTDSLGVPRTGSLAIPYRARNHFVYVPNRFGQNVARCVLDLNGDPSACSNLAPFAFNFPFSIRMEGNSAYLMDATVRNVVHCAVDADGVLSNCAITGATLTNYPSSIAIRNGIAYITDSSNGELQTCTVNVDGSLGGCSRMSLTGPAIATSIGISGDRLYIGNAAASHITRCALWLDGMPLTCLSDNIPGLTGTSSIAISGSYLYMTNNANNNVLRCTIAGDGSLSACVDAGATGLDAPFGIALFGGYAYISNANSNVLSRCTVDGAAMLSACMTYATPTLNEPGVLAIQ